ncbi:hypothetical protein ACGTJS_11345 [Faucicola mancuniensis]|uniref:hypothetical protein n=1 Tax=Faucicola mancuniensis TaxID=1309795 RepID=UPI0028E3DB9A|nr:hypothetical protein [uncultured Moraxella sp.]
MVSYAGSTANSYQKSLTSSQVGQWFFNDKGVDLYSFYNAREDLAILFEETMMFTRFGMNLYIMFLNPSNICQRQTATLCKKPKSSYQTHQRKGQCQSVQKHLKIRMG